MSDRTLSWLDLVGQLIEDPAERQRIAEVAKVHPMTLLRWVSRESTPRPASFHALVGARPQHRQILLKLIVKEFPDFPVTTEQIPAERDSVQPPSIPSFFYERLLITSKTVLPTLRFWVISNLVLRQALTQLDPDSGGLRLTVVPVVPPALGNSLRRLRPSVGPGTPPWRADPSEQSCFL